MKRSNQRIADQFHKEEDLPPIDQEHIDKESIVQATTNLTKSDSLNHSAIHDLQRLKDFLAQF